MASCVWGQEEGKDKNPRMPFRLLMTYGHRYGGMHIEELPNTITTNKQELFLGADFMNYKYSENWFARIGTRVSWWHLPMNDVYLNKKNRSHKVSMSSVEMMLGIGYEFKPQNKWNPYVAVCVSPFGNLGTKNVLYVNNGHEQLLKESRGYHSIELCTGLYVESMISIEAGCRWSTSSFERQLGLYISAGFGFKL